MITIDNLKQCSMCKEWKPATNEIFGNRKQVALGLNSLCKSCDTKRSRKWRKANPERKKETCRKWREENSERAKESVRKWRKENRERHNESNRKWREANRERAKEYNRKWRESNQEWHKKNSRKWREKNPERAKEYVRKWRKENPEKVVAKGQKRRALKANADGTATAEQIKARFQYHENSCYYCGDNESGLHVEHRIPLSRGGSNWPSNLVPACPTCNLSKGTKTEKEFINQ